MATIRFRRGNTDPIQTLAPSGLTAGEPVFNTADNKFWIGGTSGGFTAIWVGAAIENSPNWNSPSPIRLATQAAISDLVNSRVTGATGLFVTRITVSGDWRTRGVTLFSLSGTGGVTLGSEVWQGNSFPAINTAQLSSGKFGAITNTTLLTGKTPMEILELMLIDYLTPSLSNLSMGFVNASSGTQNNLAFGMTADANGGSSFSWNYSNGQNIANGATLEVTTTGLVSGSVGNLVFVSSATGIANGQNINFTPAAHYVGITVANTSTAASAVFTLKAKPTQGADITTPATYRWYPRIYHGWTTDAGLTYPPDSWKRDNVLTGLTTGGLMGINNMTSTNPDGGYSWTMPNTPGDGNTPMYVYFWIHSHWTPNVIKDAAAGGQDFAMTTGTAGTIVTGLTIDNGYTATYRRYRSEELLTSATIALRSI